MKTNKHFVLVALMMLLAHKAQAQIGQEPVKANISFGYFTYLEAGAVNLGFEVPVTRTLRFVPSYAKLISAPESEVNLDMRVYILKRDFQWFMLFGYGILMDREDVRPGLFFEDPGNLTGFNFGTGFNFRLNDNLMLMTQAKGLFNLGADYYMIQTGVSIGL